MMPQDEILAKQSPIVRSAVRELERRGLRYCTHFGVRNATEILREMDRAFMDGRLYEWLRERCGIVTDQRM